MLTDTAKSIRADLKAAGINRSFWYVLVGFDTSFQEDLRRLNFIRAHKQTAFVQRYVRNRGNLLLGKWANRHMLFSAMTFCEFLEIPEFKKYHCKYRNEIDPYFDNCFP